MNYWSDSNGFFDDNTINTPLYHLMTMFCKIMQRECFFFSFRKACPWICYSLGGECYSLWHHITSGPPGVNRLHQSPRVITPVSDSFSDLLPFTCPETEMTEDELNVLIKVFHFLCWKSECHRRNNCSKSNFNLLVFFNLELLI